MTVARAAAIVAIAASASHARGQGIDRSRRPTPPPAPTFTFPKIESHTLPNGLRLIVVEDHAVPVVSTRVVLDVDSTADPPGREGLYAVALGALREGTTSMTADQLADASAEIGTTVAPTGFTTTPQRFARGLAIAGEMLMHPLLDQPGIDRRKALQSALARRIAQMPITVPRHVFYAELYGASDPSVRSLVPTEASVAAITRDDVARFYDAHIRPDATTIVVAGDLRDADALAHVTRVFGRWARRASTAAKPAPAVVQRSPTTIYLHDVPGTQAYLYVGDAGPTRSSPDFYSVETAAAISGLRMQQALRERRAFMYSGNTGMVWRPSPQASAFVGSTSVNATKADSALVEWIALLRGLRGDQPATTRELDAVRASRVGVIPERIDGPDSLAARIVEMVRERLPFDYFDTYARHMASVTAAGVAAAASRYIDLDHLVIVVTGDRASLEPALRAAKIAPVVIVDANGKPIDR